MTLLLHHDGAGFKPVALRASVGGAWKPALLRVDHRSTGVPAAWPVVDPPTTAYALQYGGPVPIGSSVTVFTDNSGANDRVTDARLWSTDTTSNYPINIGKNGPAASRRIVVGGRVDNLTDPAKTWRELKGAYDGVGIRCDVNGWQIFDGLRTRNVMDALRPRVRVGPKTVDDLWIARNIWSVGTRDDWMENDGSMNGSADDSLVDGAYDFYSQQNGSWVGEGDVTLSNMLVKLAEYPFDFVSDPPRNDDWQPTDPDDPDRACNVLFKIQVVEGRRIPLVQSNCLWWVPNATPFSPNAMRLPVHEGCTYTDCHLLWSGPGDYPGSDELPSGVTLHVMTAGDAQDVFDAARANWLTRHGVADFDDPWTDQTIAPTAPPLVSTFL